MATQADRTLWVGNLEPRVTDEILFELFLQAGPVTHVNIAKDKEGKLKNFAFVEFKHDVSVPYSMQLMGGLPLFGRPLRLQFRSGSRHERALNTPDVPSTPPTGLESSNFHEIGGNGILGHAPMQRQGVSAMQRSTSAPGVVVMSGGEFSGGNLSLLGAHPLWPSRTVGMPGDRPPHGQTIGIPPGTPFSQGAAFQGIFMTPMGRERMGDHSPDFNGRGNRNAANSPSHSGSPGTSPHNYYDPPERRNDDIMAQADRSSERYREDFGSERNGRHSRFDQHGGTNSRDSRYEREQTGRDEGRYRDHSGSRHDHNRRGYDDARSHRRNYHSGR